MKLIYRAYPRSLSMHFSKYFRRRHPGLSGVSCLRGGLVFTLLCSLLLAGCSSNDTEDQEPAELVDFKPERYFDKVWSESVGDGQGGVYNNLKPAIYNGVVYAAAADGTVEAVTLDEGDDKWDVDLDEKLVGGVGVSSNYVMVGTATGEVVVLDRNDGKELWRKQVGGEVLAAPQSNERMVFVQTFDGQMLGLDAKDGKRLWSYRNTMPVLTLRGTSSPLMFQDSVIAGFANGHVISFDMDTGEVRWNTRVSVAKGDSEIERIVDIDGAMLETGSLLYAVSYRGKIAAIEPVSGNRVWINEASSYVGMSQGFGNIYVSDADGTVTAFDERGQGVRWAQSVLARRELTGSATMGSYVVVGDAEGYLHALSQVDGHIAARTRVDSDGLRVDVQASGDTLIVYSNDGELAAYQLVEKKSWF